MKQIVFIAAMGLTMSSIALGDDTERVVILELREDSVEFFSSLPTSDYLALAPQAIDDLTLPNGAIDYAGIRETPADFGQVTLDRFGFEISGYQIDAMSMMIHTREGAYPYTSPVEAFIAASVCGLPEQIEALPADQTRIYQSAFVDMPDRPVSFSFTAPQAAHPIDFRVFADDGRMLSQAVLQPSETITVDAIVPPHEPVWQRWKLGVGVILLAVSAGLFAWGVSAPGTRRKPIKT